MSHTQHPFAPIDEGDLRDAQAWLTAAIDPAINQAIGAMYAEVSQAITRQGPACWASGRCCNFEKTGHRLYVTGLEAAWCITRVGRPGLAAIHTSMEQGNCPYLTGEHRHLCGVHEAKPLGCRVYFCDRTSFPWQSELTESQLGVLRTLHEERAIPYRYAEWRYLLYVLEHAPMGMALGRFAGGAAALPISPSGPITPLTRGASG
jgi:Fe-S-cluster containining protein